EGQEVVVATTPRLWVVAADRRPRVVDGALSCRLIKKSAHGFVDVILADSKHPALDASDFGVALFGLFVRQAKMLCDSNQVPFADIEKIVAAAIGRALRAVVQYVQTSAILAAVTVSAHPLPQKFFVIIATRHSSTRTQAVTTTDIGLRCGLGSRQAGESLGESPANTSRRNTTPCFAKPRLLCEACREPIGELIEPSQSARPSLRGKHRSARQSRLVPA